MEKWDCCELPDRPIVGCCADLPNGREWVGSGHYALEVKRRGKRVEQGTDATGSIASADRKFR